MKSNFVVVGVVLLVVLGAGYGAYFLLNKNEVEILAQNDAGTPATSSQLEDAYIEVPVATTKSENGGDPNAGLTYRLTYPEIALLGHKKEASEASAVIKTFAMDILSSFQKDVAEIGGERTKESETSDLTLLASPTLLSPTIISLRFDVSEYIAGSAHPSSYTRVFNYDIEERRLLGIEDLFASTTDALLFLSEFSRSALRERFSDLTQAQWDETVLDGTQPTQENFSSIALRSDGLLLIFNPYQVAPYARGAQEVFVPQIAIDHLLAPRIKGALRLSATNYVSASSEIPLQMQD